MGPSDRHVRVGSYPTFAELKIDGLRCGTVKLTELHFELEQGRTAHVQQDVLLVTDEVPGDHERCGWGLRNRQHLLLWPSGSSGHKKREECPNQGIYIYEIRRS